jgi:3-oxoacyl-[acyl-carrier-protein] synthase II
MGMVSPIGHTVDESWQAAIAGQSGVGLNESFDATDFGVKICASVKDFEIAQYINPKEARRMDSFIQLGIAAASQAIEDAGLDSHPDDADRIGVAIGSGIGGISTIEDTHATLVKSGPRRVSPFFRAGRGDQHDFR